MRTERNQDGSYNVWMSRDEYHEFPRGTGTFEQEIAIRLMGDCGLESPKSSMSTPRISAGNPMASTSNSKSSAGRTLLARMKAASNERRECPANLSRW